MTKTVTPSEQGMTAGQIGKIQEVLSAGLRKSDLRSEPTQVVLETQGEALVDELVAVIRKRIELVSDTIIRRVKVDRTKTPQEMLDATGRRQYTDKGVVANMPGRGESLEEVEVVFFKLGQWVSDEDLEKEYELRGLKPCDPYALAAVNEVDPVFADGHPNGTHLKDENDHWCFVTFGRWYDERSVYVDRRSIGWSGSGWFSGSRKPR